LKRVDPRREIPQNMGTTNVTDLLAQSAAGFGERIAIKHLEQELDYRSLWAASCRLAARLQRLNLPAESRVAILFENSIDYAVCFFGVMKAGLVAVPMDTSLVPEKLNFVLKDSEARAFLMQSRYRRHLARIIEDVSNLQLIVTDKVLKPEAIGVTMEKLGDIISADTVVETPTAPGDEDLDKPKRHVLAAIFYTSGSTGLPKGVMLSHLNLVSNTMATVKYLRLVPTDSVMVILPFYYIYGNSLLLTHVAVGGTLVIDNRFMYPEVVLDAMEQEQVTGFSGVPSHFMLLLNNSTFVKRNLEHLRYFTQAGGAMAPEVIRRLVEAFPQKETWIMYGQTEAAPRVTWLPPEDVIRKLGSIGIEVPGVTVEIVDDAGSIAPVGKSGELIVIGDNVMMGYWKQPEETAEVLREGRLYTGDLARRDEEGYIYITGRRREIIKSGGNRVSAKEVEERILENEKVAEATVFGVADDILGEAIKAAVVLKPGCIADEKEIQSHCQQTLAVHKVPRFVVFMTELPKLQSGKVNKLVLQHQIS